jgi:hypothetical protein
VRAEASERKRRRGRDWWGKDSVCVLRVAGESRTCARAGLAADLLLAADVSMARAADVVGMRKLQEVGGLESREKGAVREKHGDARCGYRGTAQPECSVSMTLSSSQFNSMRESCANATRNGPRNRDAGSERPEKSKS